jgi:hypothetical protein
MRKICWNITASIALIIFSQTASAAPGSRAAVAVGNSARPNLSERDDPTSDARSIAGILRDFSSRTAARGGQLDLDEARVDLLAQAGAPAPAATTPPADSKEPRDPSPPAVSSPPNPTSTEEVARAAPTVPGCAIKYMAAEVAGKLNGRKWKEFREEECGAGTTQAVFPTTIAPKYSGASPDKARTLTCADQFSANKATNANGGMKWIEKSGGYYGECVSRLKG